MYVTHTRECSTRMKQRLKSFCATHAYEQRIPIRKVHFVSGVFHFLTLSVNVSFGIFVVVLVGLWRIIWIDGVISTILHTLWCSNRNTHIGEAHKHLRTYINKCSQWIEMSAPSPWLFVFPTVAYRICYNGLIKHNKNKDFKVEKVRSNIFYNTP